MDQKFGILVLGHILTGAIPQMEALFWFYYHLFNAVHPGRWSWPAFYACQHRLPSSGSLPLDFLSHTSHIDTQARAKHTLCITLR